MRKIKERLKSVRVKLFLSLAIVIVLIIAFLIIMNNIVLETFYLYSKKNALKAVYIQINEYYNNSDNKINLEEELEKIEINNNFDIAIKDNTNDNIYTTNKDFLFMLGEWNNNYIRKSEEILEQNKNMTIKKVKDKNTDISYIVLLAKLDNGYFLSIRIPLTSIKESVRISNRFLYLIGGFTIIIGGIVVSFISRKFTKRILELNDIAKKMSDLDFSQKYKPTEAGDEIDSLGKSINKMSGKLEGTINQLRNTNFELEKDIEEKSKINEMRTKFISDVSHELKTPIALIQGYSEGLLENITTDEESRKFYAEVILDETNKMDKLVKQLLELSKLEYGKREFNNSTFNIIELEKEVVRKAKVMLDEKNIKVELKTKGNINVFADDFYIEQVITNYLTNAIKHTKEVAGEKYIKIENEIDKNKNKVIVRVFNTGDIISEENKTRIWNRFYKIDESRNRDDGGTGIGLALVRAIMNNYNSEYGVENKVNGVEFYFELDLSDTEK